MISFILKIALIVLVVSYIFKVLKIGTRKTEVEKKDSKGKRINTKGLNIKDAKFNDIEDEK